MAAALATVMHHSSGKVHTAYGAPRGQRLATRAMEVEVREPDDALRGQKPPPPGVLLGLPQEPGPQRSDRTLRRSAGDALPQLATPSLASSASEAVEASVLAFSLSLSVAGGEGARGAEGER